MGKKMNPLQVQYKPRDSVYIDGRASVFEFNDTDTEPENFEPETFKLTLAQHRNQFSIKSTDTQNTLKWKKNKPKNV